MCEVGRVTGAIDTHTHLNHPRLFRRLGDVLRRAREAGVVAMIVVGYDLPSSELAAKMAGEHEGLYAAVGVHPHDASQVDAGGWSRLRRLAQCEGVVAVGETGLDFHRNLSPREAQVDAFRRHLELAEELELPVIVHCRAAQEAVLKALAAAGDLCRKVVWHSFDGESGHAEGALSLGLTLGFGGLVTYGRAEALRGVAAGVPEDRMLLETDCPYLSPEPNRSRDNEPANIWAVAECLAGVRGTTAEQVMATAAGNARRLFGLSEEGHA